MKVFLPVQWSPRFSDDIDKAYAAVPDNTRLLVFVMVEAGEITPLLERRARAICSGYPHESETIPKRVDFEVILTSQPVWTSIGDRYEDGDLILWLYRSFQPIVERFVGAPDITPMLERFTGNYLILNESNQKPTFGTMAFATDFSEGSKGAFQRMTSLHRDLGTLRGETRNQTHVITVVKPTREVDTLSMAEMEHRYKDADVIKVIKHTSVLDGIRTYIEGGSADFLSIYLPQRNILGKLAHYHLTRDLIHKTDFPILLIVN